METKDNGKFTTRSRGISRNMQKILDYLLRTKSGATPKMIASATSLNVNTVKSILPQMENVKKFTRGWYKVEIRGDAPCASSLHNWTFHNLIVTYSLKKYWGEHLTKTYDFDLLKFHLTITKLGQVTLRLASPYPVNLPSIVLVQAYFSQIMKEHTQEPVLSEKTLINTIEFNTDYKNLRLDGVKAITLDNLITHFKIYQKDLVLRKEHKTKHKFSTENIIDMLTQHPNELELSVRLKEQEKQLNRLIVNTQSNYNLTMKLIEKLTK